KKGRMEKPVSSGDGETSAVAVPPAVAPVFISFANANLSEATIIHDDLLADGIACWMAPRKIVPGDDYREAIVEGFEAATVVLVLVSTASLTSEQVAREVNLATNDKRK